MPEDFNELEDGRTVRGFAGGQRIFGRYVLVKFLGQGGMGIVWLAKDETLDENVALKFLPEAVRMDAAAVDELKRETRKSRKLAHPYIVKIYDFVDDAGGAAISMEYVDGMTLSKVRTQQEHKVLMPSQVEGILQQLADALTYAHESVRIVHRDLKPANLMLTARGDLRVTDFGISSSISDSVSQVSMRRGSSGSPPYMSPQQVMGETPTVADDIYSFGATVYELLTGKPPFFRGDIYQQLRSVVPPPMTQRREEIWDGEASPEWEPIPPSWEAAIAACLAKDASDRPSSVQQAVQKMLSTEDSPPPVLEPPPAPPPPEEQRKAPVWPWLLAAGTLTVIVLGGVLYLNQGPDIPDKPSPPDQPDSSVVQNEEVKPIAQPSPPLSPTTFPVAIEGYVETPGKVTVTEGTTVREAIAMAGGANALSDPENVLIYRDQNSKIIPIDLNSEDEANNGGMLIRSGDWIQVQEKVALALPTDEPITGEFGRRFLPAGTPGVLFAETEVTVGDFGKFVDSSGYDCTDGVFSNQGGSWSPGVHSWKDPGFPQDSTHPVTGISWKDANAYCEWLTQQGHASGKLKPSWRYRLPTDVEWSRAVGLRDEPGASPKEKDMSSKTSFPWGDQWPPPAAEGNMAGQNPGTTPAGQGNPNSYGLRDMFGNVWEWCEDSYEPRRKWKVLRGGGWAWGSQDTREYTLGFRYFEEPAARWTNFGLRPVIDKTGDASDS